MFFKRSRLNLCVLGVLLVEIFVSAQSTPTPTNDAPNPYGVVAKWTLPDGRMWGALSAVDIDLEFDQPHALAFDSKERLFVGDRNNNRIQILDQDGSFLEEWTQFSRPSGMYIDRNDRIYVADSESGSVARNHPGWKRGIRIGSARDGKLDAFIPDPDEAATGTSAAEGVAADSQGNVYGAEVGPRSLKRYAKK
jgi:sugar lactone lactonase YvrE